jgi:hypothetical protein
MTARLGSISYCPNPWVKLGSYNYLSVLTTAPAYR